MDQAWRESPGRAKPRTALRVALRPWASFSSCRLEWLFPNLLYQNFAYVIKCLCLPDSVTGALTVVD